MSKFILILVLPFVVTCVEQNEKFFMEKRSLENQCSADEDMAGVCKQCVTLPFYGMTSLVTCCSDEYTFQFCQMCISDQQSCRKLLRELETFNPLWMQKRNAKTSVDNGTNDPQRRMRRSSALASIFNRPTSFRNLLSGKGKSLSLLRELTNPDVFYNADADNRFGQLYMRTNQYFGKRGAGKK